jgi:hypothetical protein
MLNITVTIKVSVENCQKLARLGTLEDFFNSLIEWLLGIYYDREKKITITATTGCRRGGGTGKTNNNTGHEYRFRGKKVHG